MFWDLFGADPAASRAKALRAWSRLSAVDRAQALALLPRFLDHCRANKRRICDPSTYLGERRWDAFVGLPAASAPAKPEPARPPEADPVRRAVLWALSDKADRTEWIFIEQGSPEWQLWREAFGLAGLGHRWMAGRHDMVPTAGGGWGRSAVPGRRFPMLRPPRTDGGSDPPASGGAAPADDDIDGNW